MGLTGFADSNKSSNLRSSEILVHGQVRPGIPTFLLPQRQFYQLRAMSSRREQHDTTSTSRESKLHDPCEEEEEEMSQTTAAKVHASQAHQAPQLQTSSPALPHLTNSGSAHMIPVTRKPRTVRTAIAIGTVLFSQASTATKIQHSLLKKGDVLATARVAGIMAAKMCPRIVPLCHPIEISGIQVDVELSNGSKGEDGQRGGKRGWYGGVEIEARVECVGTTGVEMEALTAVSGAALTVVDMVKGVDRGTRIEGVRVVFKAGGKTTWVGEGWEEKVRRGL